MTIRTGIWTEDLPLILVEPWVDAFLEFARLQGNDIATLLSWQSHFLLLEGALSICSTRAQLLFLYLLEHDCVFARDFWKEPPASFVPALICHIDLKLDLIVNDDCDDFWVRCPHHSSWLNGIRLPAWRLNRGLLLLMMTGGSVYAWWLCVSHLLTKFTLLISLIGKQERVLKSWL